MTRYYTLIQDLEDIFDEGKVKIERIIDEILKIMQASWALIKHGPLCQSLHVIGPRGNRYEQQRGTSRIYLIMYDNLFYEFI